MDLLQQLSLTAGVAGQEHRVRELILGQTKGLFDEVKVDPLGSLIGFRKARPAPGSGKNSGKAAEEKTSGGGRPLKVMIAAHMDQIGFVVRYVDDKGFLRLQNVGGFDTRNLFARLVTVCPDAADPSKDLPGVLNPGGKPLHIASEEDKRKIPEISDLAVDLGLPPEEVKGKVKVGDMVVIRAQFAQVGKLAVGQAMDNRIACWVAIRAIQALKHHPCDIHCCFTVQEEVGCRGAGPAAAAIKPDVAISLDTTLAVDTPGVPDDQCVSKSGGGAGLMVLDSSVIIDPGLLKEFEDLARKQKIKAQRTILPRGGNDACTIQRTGEGIRVMTVVCPTRYIHTITEAANVDDLHACRDLLAAYLAQAK